MAAYQVLFKVDRALHDLHFQKKFKSFPDKRMILY